MPLWNGVMHHLAVSISTVFVAIWTYEKREEKRGKIMGVYHGSRVQERWSLELSCAPKAP